MSTLFQRTLPLLMLGLVFGAQLPAQCPDLVWSDEFDGESLDPSSWSYQLGDGCAISPDLCGWGNNELQYYRAENARVEDGMLYITAKQESFGGRGYTSARLRTLDLAEWTYGRFEARMKLPTGQGMWPAFWMLPSDEVYGGWPQSGEIDIMELIGSEPSTVHGTIHFGNPWPNNASSGGQISLPAPRTFNDDFHVFAVEWEPGEIRWYLDGYLYSRKTPADVSPRRWPFDQDFHLLLNLAVGGNWPGPPDGSTIFPQELVVDYVRVYSGGAPRIEGPSNVVFDQLEDTSTFTVVNPPPDAQFEWSVPEFATITQGQGTASIDVNFRVWSGPVTVRVSSPCYTDTLQVFVTVEPGYEKWESLENFDEPGKVSYTSSTGTFADAVSNPDPGPPNASDLVGQYRRDDTQQFDVFTYRTGVLQTLPEFLFQKKFYLDVYTDAPEGTTILIQLEDSGAAQSDNYPTGRHSRYEAVTTRSGAWDRLAFSLLDEPDPNVPESRVDQVILLFAPNTFSGHTYYFDNFDLYDQAILPGAFSPPALVDHFDLYPNPAGDSVQLRYRGEEALRLIQIIDGSGRILRQQGVRLGSGEDITLSLDDVPAGAYHIRGVDAAGATGLKRLVKK